MDFREFLRENNVCLDGGMGTLLQERGLAPGQLPEEWNLTHPEIITEIHKSYFLAGSNVVSANTFGANLLKFSPARLEEIISAAISNARRAQSEAHTGAPKFVALDIGPTGKLLKPLGDLDFEAAVSVFAETVKLGAKYGADLILIETVNDSYETKAALLAAKENSRLPVIVTNAYGADGKLMTGATPGAMVALIEGMGADALGANCSLGPSELAPVALELLKKASIPVVLKPNAGIPRSVQGKTVFDVTPEAFAAELKNLVQAGVRVFGGCCGTTPEHIAALTSAVKDIPPAPLTEKSITAVASYTHAVEFGSRPVLIGERINPTGKKRFKQALLEHDMDYILAEGASQQEKGVHILDVNVGLPGIDEVEMLTEATAELQAICDLPLQLDTANISALEAALRRYNGKAMINSVNGKAESMAAIFPLVKKYGGLVVALTLDEGGIPPTARGRIEIAEKILATAQSFGISKKDIIFDTLAMTVSADNRAGIATLEALKDIKTRLGCHTSLGVSNVSFGLPCRDALNSVFFAMALENGLSAAIMNPYSPDMMKTYHSYLALKGLDENCESYIAAAEGFGTAAPAASEKKPTEPEAGSGLQYAIVKGMRERAAEITGRLLESTEPLEIVNSEIIPALNTVGRGFEEKTVYLPQLLIAAEAAKAAFEVIKSRAVSGKTGEQDRLFVLATVKGDIHDIGKNIVKLLLENYGFQVIDLGRDVPPEAIVSKVVETMAPLVGLSALMTTTVPAMEETICQLRAAAPWCKIIVGGAVLTEDYASAIGADKYAADAMETVRYAQSILK